MEWLILYSFLSNVVAAKVCPDLMRFDEVDEKLSEIVYWVV